MLIAACSAQERNRRHLEATFRMDRLVVGIRIDPSRLVAETVDWADFWRPAARYLGADTRLVHRLNRLKRAWSEKPQRSPCPSSLLLALFRSLAPHPRDRPVRTSAR